MADLKSIVKSKLFGGKIRFRSEERKQEESTLQAGVTSEEAKGNEPMPEKQI